MADHDIRHAPAAGRNGGPILDVLRRTLPARGDVLEIASGTGQHVELFAAALPMLRWQPSDPDPVQRASINARVAAADLGNVAAPLDLNVLDPWPPLRVHAVIVANLLHVAPAEALPALCEGAAAALQPGGILHVYGPFRRGGAYTSDGNRRFDSALRTENPCWGLRDAESLLACAAEHGLDEAEIIDMPANNLSIVCRRSHRP
ncbi:MAG: DUF938 domain-containing protein [Pseudomonadales bacterium]